MGGWSRRGYSNSISQIVAFDTLINSGFFVGVSQTSRYVYYRSVNKRGYPKRYDPILHPRWRLASVGGATRRGSVPALGVALVTRIN